MLSYLLTLSLSLSLELIGVKVGTWVGVKVRVGVWVGDKGKQIDRTRGRQIGRQADSRQETDTPIEKEIGKEERES